MLGSTHVLVRRGPFNTHNFMLGLGWLIAVTKFINQQSERTFRGSGDYDDRVT